MRLHKLISFRLFITIAVVLTILTFSVSYIQLSSQASDYEEVLSDCGNRVCNMIRRSTRESMLLNRTQDTQNIIETIVQEKGIEKIRVCYKGKIIFSTENTEIGDTLKELKGPCLVCHQKAGSIFIPEEKIERKTVFNNPDGSRTLSFVTPIQNEKSCYTADCHYHNENQKILGVIDVRVSLKTLDEILSVARQEMISENIIITLLLALTAGGFIWIFVHIPVKRLINATKAVSSGDLNHKIETSSEDEIGQLAQSFNKMTNDLLDAKKEITEWSNELETRVEEKTEELKRTQDQILHIEKMASLGKLSATVAHEINNPLAGILTYSKLIQKRLDKLDPIPQYVSDILRELKLIETESARCGSIIKNMLVFSKKEEPDFKLHNINSILKNSVQLINHHLTLNNITLEENFSDNVPEINVDEAQIKQVFLALFINAVEAMKDQGVLKVESKFNVNSNEVEISVSDNGKGIPNELISNIFEPFYTTKSEVKGVGLGLSVVYGIVKKHKGDITVSSKINFGSTFTIKLPAI